MLSPELMRQFRRLQLKAKRAVQSLLEGRYHSAFRGTGLAFEEVREYQPGDDVRSIDWNVTARMGGPFVKRYVEERELTVLLVADLSGSLGFGSRLNFGDAQFTYIGESSDDRLTMFASGLNFSGGADGSLFTGTGISATNFSTLAATQATAGNSAIYGLVSATGTSTFLSPAIWGRNNGAGNFQFGLYAQGGQGSGRVLHALRAVDDHAGPLGEGVPVAARAPEVRGPAALARVPEVPLGPLARVRLQDALL